MIERRSASNFLSLLGWRRGRGNLEQEAQPQKAAPSRHHGRHSSGRTAFVRPVGLDAMLTIVAQCTPRRPDHGAARGTAVRPAPVRVHGFRAYRIMKGIDES